MSNAKTLWLVYNSMSLSSNGDDPSDSSRLLLHADSLESSNSSSLFPYFELPSFELLPSPTLPSSNLSLSKLPFPTLSSFYRLLFPMLSFSKLFSPTSPSFQQMCLYMPFFKVPSPKLYFCVHDFFLMFHLLL